MCFAVGIRLTLNFALVSVIKKNGLFHENLLGAYTFLFPLSCVALFHFCRVHKAGDTDSSMLPQI